MPWHPHPYQRNAVKFLLEHAAAGLFLDPGLGKTSITLAAIKVLKAHRLLESALVIAPLRPCYEVWPEQVDHWQDFNSLRYSLLHGKNKEERLGDAADIYIINPEGLDWLVAEDRLRRLGVDTLVVDESTKFKHTNTKRFKLMRNYINSFRRRWILTGTPNPNGYMDLFGQIFLLDGGKTLGRYITHFRSTYFLPVGMYDWRLKPGADKQIQEAIRPFILRLDAEDYIKLPKLQDNVIRVTLPDRAQRMYDEIEEEFFTELDGRAVTAANVGASMNKCAQVANGGLYLYDEDNPRQRITASLHTAKTDALAELVEELQGTPLLVAYEFQHDIARIQEGLRPLLGEDAPWVGGGVSVDRTRELLKAWNAGQLRVLLGHPASVGHGLNLQSGGNHICWYGVPWDYELYDQFIRRLRRQGSKFSKVFVHHLVASGTVDEVKLRALHAKERDQRTLLNALRDYSRSKKRRK